MLLAQPLTSHYFYPNLCWPLTKWATQQHGGVHDKWLGISYFCLVFYRDTRILLTITTGSNGGDEC